MLAQKNRLTKKSDFLSVRQNGKFVGSKLLSISYVDRGDEEPSRFGFIVSKKISTSSVVRNKVKRTLREIIRKNIVDEKRGLDVVVLVKGVIIHKTSSEIEKEVQAIFKEI